VAGVGVAASLIGVGLAPSGILLALAVLIGGIANTLNQPACNLALARRLPPRRLGLAFALKQSSIPIASMIGGLAVPTFGLLIGWRGTIAMCAALAAAVLLMAWATISREAPRPRRVAKQGAAPVRALLPLTLAGVTGAAASTGMIAFFVDSATTDGVGSGAAGIWFACAGVVAIAGRFLGGWLADGWRRRPPLAFCLAAFFGIGAAGYALLSFAHSWPLRVAASLPAFAAGWGWQGMFHHATVLLSPAAPARATGVTQTGLSIGAFVGPITFGTVVEAASFDTAWLVVAGLMASAAVIVAFSPRREQRPSAAVPDIAVTM
jgi:predicted MFS family arabinose efflux permease